MKAIINGKIITEDNVLYEKVILFNKKIQQIISKSEFNDLTKHNPIEEIDLIDAKGSYISPGFIDVHIHGSGGSDTMDGTIDALTTISKVISSNGVTSFLPTTMTMDKEKIYKALDTIEQCMKLDLGGATILGAHMEGPFISKKYKGAQNPDYIIKPDYSFIENYIDVIKILTIAPENDDNFSFISKVKENTKITLSIGHSDSTYEEAMAAIKKGVTHATHIFNVMTPLNHRNPGIIGAIFNSDICCELIADSIHVHPSIFKIVSNIKRKDKIILITDSMRAGCLKDGISELGGQKVIVENNSARLEDGTLAGSILKLNKAVKNFMDNTNIPIYEAVAMASLNPAKNIGMDNTKGSLKIGKDADITIFDENFEIQYTIVNGKTVFQYK